MNRKIALSRGMAQILTAVASGRNLKGVSTLIESDMGHFKSMLFLNGLTCPESVERLAIYGQLSPEERIEMARRALND